MAQRAAMVESQSLMWLTTVRIPTRRTIPAVVAFPPAHPGSIEAISRPLLSWKATIGHFQREKWPPRGTPAQVEPFSVHFSLQKWQMVTFEERSGMLIEIVHFEQIKALPRTWHRTWNRIGNRIGDFFAIFPPPPAAEDPSPSPHRPVSPPTMRESLTCTHAHTHAHTYTCTHDWL